MSTAKFKAAVPEPLLLVAVMVYGVERETASGVPVMMHVVLLRTSPAGKAGEAVQVLGAPPERVGA